MPRAALMVQVAALLFAVMSALVDFIGIALILKPGVVQFNLGGQVLLIGLLATGAQLLVTRAHAHAPAARIGPFMYSIVVFAALLDMLLWDERLDDWSLLGAILVIGAVILAGRTRLTEEAM